MKNALQPGVTPHLAEDKHKQMNVIKKTVDEGLSEVNVDVISSSCNIVDFFANVSDHKF